MAGLGIAPEDLTALLELRLLPGVGDKRLSALLQRHGSARGALAAPAEELGTEAAAARGTTRIAGRVERALEAIERLDIAVLTGFAAPNPVDSASDAAGYPARLHELHDPPVVLFARGDLELLDRPAVAVIGSRRHTEYGADVARALAGDLARAGVVVISGMARGIDSIAHVAALAGGTVGVLGCGIDVVYPPENRRLYERAATEGLLVSEFTPGDPPLCHHFPRRNRLIAALARGVVVVEASAESGALITVDHALDLGREVFAVPGPVGRRTSEGTNALIRDGARLVAGIGDVLEELGMPVSFDGAATNELGTGAAPPVGLSECGLCLWRAMGEEPVHIDGLAAACGLSPASALAALLELELAGQVRQLPGKRFKRA